MPTPDPPSADDAQLPEIPADVTHRSRRQGVVAVTHWFVAGGIYIALGVAVPWMFLLGFWQALIFVACVTALQPVVMRRFG